VNIVSGLGDASNNPIDPGLMLKLRSVGFKTRYW